MSKGILIKTRLNNCEARDELRRVLKLHTGWMLDTSSPYPQHIHEMAQAILFAVEKLRDEGD